MSRPRLVRRPRHADSYLGSGDALRENLAGLVRLTGADEPARDRDLLGLIAPHVDLPRGWACYGAAYAPVAVRAPADVYVILGTAHASVRSCFIGTRTDFATPFGTLEIDDDLLDAVVAGYGERFFDETEAHVNEHSVEFQTLFVAHLFAEAAADGPVPTILPVLCATQRSHILGEQLPWTDARYVEFVAVLGDAIARSGRSICVIAGADLAHMGPEFGHSIAMGKSERRGLRARDQETMALACAMDARGFWNDVVAGRNPRQICGLAPIYTMLCLLEGQVHEAAMLSYGQTNDSLENVVSYAAAAFYG